MFSILSVRIFSLFGSRRGIAAVLRAGAGAAGAAAAGAGTAGAGKTADAKGTAGAEGFAGAVATAFSEGSAAALRPMRGAVFPATGAVSRRCFAATGR